jgi:hypothetical protein
MSHIEGQHNEGNTSHVDGEGEGSGTSHADSENQLDGGNVQPQQSQAVAAHVQAMQRRKIAQLEEKLETMQSGRALKERCSHYVRILMYCSPLSGKQSGMLLKEEQSGVLSPCSTVSRILSPKMTEDTRLTLTRMLLVLLSQSFALCSCTLP